MAPMPRRHERARPGKHEPFGNATGRSLATGPHRLLQFRAL